MIGAPSIGFIRGWLNIEHDDINCVLKDSSEQLAWMQFTGLRDKNGKDVYEGDILHHKGRNYWVVWKDYKWHFKRMHLGKPEGGHPFNQIFRWPENFEVIGDIYDNPELLK